MHRVLFVLALLGTVVSTGSAQVEQAPAAAPIEQPTPVTRVEEAPLAAVEPSAVRATAVQPREVPAENTATREVSARSLFAIIGVVVVAVALIALAM